MAAMARIELPQAGASGVPFISRRTWLSAISCSSFSLRVGSVTRRIIRTGSAGHGGLDRERMQLACVGALANRPLDEPVLLDATQALELRGGDVDPKVVAAALVDHLDRCPRQGLLDQLLDVVDEHLLGAGRRLGMLEHLLDAHELHARAALRLTGGGFGGVKGLPALERDVVGLALVEQGLDRAAIGGE